MKILEGRLVLVTGGGRGIGRAIALALAENGAELVLAARTKSELQETIELCRGLGARAHLVPTDMGDPQQVDRLAEVAIAVKGRVDVLVNNAGVYGPIGPSHEVDFDVWDRAHRVNLLGPFRLYQKVVPSMISRKRGKIIFLAGGGATAPLPLLSAYASSKAAVVRLAETLAEEVKGYNVQVNAISPGLVDTRLQDEVLHAGERAGPLFARIRNAREKGTGAVSPVIAAQLVVFLASDESGALTGKLIAAPHDSWRAWKNNIGEINDSPWFTLRRLDPFTIKPLVKGIS